MERASRFKVSCDHLFSGRWVKATFIRKWRHAASKCDIVNVLVVLGIHAGLQRGRNNVRKKRVVFFLLILRIVLLSL